MKKFFCAAIGFVPPLAFGLATAAWAGPSVEDTLGNSQSEELAVSDNSSDKYYLALGDSFAAGQEPGVDTRLGNPNGYPEQLTDYWNSIGEKTKLRNLACPGVTAATMISGSEYCDLQHGVKSELQQALDEIHAHANQIKLITFTLGGGDVLDCVNSGTFPACFPDTLAGLASHLDTILTAIRAEAGPAVPILATNYADPFLASWLVGDQQAAIDSYTYIVHPGNLALAAAYAAHGSLIADVETAFATSDFTTLVDVPELGGLVPINVANICRWTHTCTEGDFHPNRDGYTVIKDTILATLP
jgi:lysophospholipase L1-like esterase